MSSSMWPYRLVHSSAAADDVEDDCEGVFHAAAKNDGNWGSATLKHEIQYRIERDF